MNVPYSILVNVQYDRPGKWHGYVDSDLLCRTWQGEVEVDETQAREIDLSDAMYHACETLFARHNRDDRPDGQVGPSLSVGDVVVIGETAFSCEPQGWSLLTARPAFVVTDEPWTAVSRRMADRANGVAR